jgi:septal ring factor EnvC (AmiA/AmiB activator)
VEQEWSKSGARVEQEWSKSGARVEREAAEKAAAETARAKKAQEEAERAEAERRAKGAKVPLPKKVSFRNHTPHGSVLTTLQHKAVEAIEVSDDAEAVPAPVSSFVDGF